MTKKNKKKQKPQKKKKKKKHTCLLPWRDQDGNLSCVTVTILRVDYLFSIFSFSISMLIIVLSHLFIFCVPRSTKKPGQNKIFHRQALLKVDSRTKGVVWYPSFLANSCLSSLIFQIWTVTLLSSLISAIFCLVDASQILVPFIPVKVMSCLELLNSVQQDEHEMQMDTNNKIFFIN